MKKSTELLVIGKNNLIPEKHRCPKCNIVIMFDSSMEYCNTCEKWLELKDSSRKDNIEVIT